MSDELKNPCKDPEITAVVAKSAPFKCWRTPGTQDLPLPTYHSREASGFDIHISEDVTLPPGQVVVANTGLHVSFPRGIELQIRMRGGSAKRGILLANAPGTVDSDYRGELKLLLVNVTTTAIDLKRGERPCQGVLCPVFQGVFYKVDELEDLGSTERGEGRFNSTGTAT